MRKLLFVDRDGTLIREPENRQVDALEKVALMDEVIPALRRFVAAGYELVMVSNQDGLGGATYPRAAFEKMQQFLLTLFASQGLRFAGVHICPHRAQDGCDCRKPRVGLVMDYLREGFDRERSAVVGDRSSDLEFAEAMGVHGFRLDGIEGPGASWLEIARELLEAPRRGECRRRTRETTISARVTLDDDDAIAVNTGIGFFDHMLDSLARHGGFGLELECRGDLAVDEHHTVEDCALALGNALGAALGERRGIARFGFALPMDDAHARTEIDLGGRPYFVFDGAFPREAVGGLPTELVPHFFRSLADGLRMNLHLSVHGENAHHMVEACFKVVGRALRQALAREGDAVPSTKGVL